MCKKNIYFFSRKILALLLLFFTSFSCIFAQIDIWEGVKGKPKVKMTPYLVEGSGNVSVVVCPGGSYFWHATETEGHAVARWLQANHIASFVLEYRVAGFPAFMIPYRYIFRGHRYPDPQEDLKQALRLIRRDSVRYGISPDKVGAMGFSAGGHLVMSAAERFDRCDRPDFVAPIYPVVTMDGEFVHKRSRRALFGDNKKKDKDLIQLLSLEKQVPEDCPPVFLVNCKDDPTVCCQNSVMLDSALTASKVDHLYLQYETGGHGFGVDTTKGTAQVHQWENRFLEWLQSLNL